ncbi:hypothetical protein OIU83_14685 [Flavobacterium sp. LS1R49]|uniref:Secreted protein n=1 Tax=Flavobacterium shii TaxID=2987687 RepID=A0A9X3BYJ5_9FLAO|nr:hypothetical protein [Flavobacterium shii]MCV9928915.1 hypothetical protein [Flavobacterium shii]
MKLLKNLFIGILFLTISSSHAQVSVNVNIGTPPAWGPTGHTDARYYYLPDLQMYYDINASSYLYQNNGKWLRSRNLPKAYRNYDLYNGYKVVLNNYRGNTPYDNFNTHREKYGKGYRGEPQQTIGQRPGKGYGDKNHDHDDGHRDGDGHGNGHGHDKH